MTIIDYKLIIIYTLLFSCNYIEISEGKHNHTIHEKLRDDPDLSQFFFLMESNPMALASLQHRSVTVFAPTNHAYQKHAPSENSIVLYHISNSPLTLNQLGSLITSELDGNPPLWVTRAKLPGSYREEVFINNAKVIHHKSNVVLTNARGSKQILHVLDRVLKPVWPIQADLGVYNPDAYQFLNISENLTFLENHRLRSFRQRINAVNKQEIFSHDGRFTFFIPVDEGFQPSPRPDKIDAKVIEGHVIPDHVLFTTPTPDGYEYQTLAFSDTVKVTVSFSTEIDGKETKKYVKSNTLVGDATHPSGVVIAEIVRANIPVRNGVVHLIHRPLMVVDTTVSQFLESFKVQEDGPLFKFYEVIRDVEGDFMDRLTRMKELTLFAPSNSAWKDPGLNLIIRDRKKIQEILHMHVVEEKLPLEKIASKNVKQVSTLTPRKNLYFNIIVSNEGNKTLTVEGGGVNATVIQPNIAATNGIVHMIDRVLGVPFTTVQRKLATDPMLNKTYFMGQAQGFNNQLDDANKRFTYFVPRDLAWKKVENRYPSVHKKLFMRDFSYHARQILERHLVIADQAFSMAELKNMTLFEAKRLPTVRDDVKIKVKESEKSYYILWNNEWIHVFRPDVECTNGVIHVIDTVFLRQSDVSVSRATPAVSVVHSFHVALGFIICLLISHYL